MTPSSLLLALGIPVCAIAGLVLGLSARSKLRSCRARRGISKGELRLQSAGRHRPPPPAEQQARRPLPEAPTEEAPHRICPDPEPKRPGRRVSVPTIQARNPAAGSARQDFEEKLGSRWAVWVGGVALALGGIFLVRYSIEQNLLSPATRIALGGLFALALIGAGEWLRRREQRRRPAGHSQRERAERSSPRPEPAAPSPRPMRPMRSMT